MLTSLIASTEATFWLPRAASTGAEAVDPLFDALVWVSWFFFILIAGLTIWFAVRYRRRRDDEMGEEVRESKALEVVWTVVPTLMLLGIFYWGFTAYVDLTVPPKNILDVRVTARQWGWQFEYPEQGTKSDQLVVPVGQAVKLTMSSVDVIHSFYVPEFRIKRDVLPDRYSVTWFEATDVGDYDILCAEYCGTSHSAMSALVRVVTKPEFEAWLEAESGFDDLPLAERGELLVRKNGCTQCHSLDGAPGVAPTFLGSFGSERTFIDGSTQVMDRDYVRESIYYPARRVVKGYVGQMPTYKGTLDDDDVSAIAEYLATMTKKEP